MFTPKEAKAWEKRAKERVRRASQQAVVLAANRVIVEIQTVIVPSFPDKERPVNKNNYVRGWRWRKTGRGALIYNLTLGGYGAFIEYGVRGKNVKISKKMIDALSEWIKDKGIGATAHVSSKGKVTMRPPSEMVRRQMALQMARKMRGRGIFNRNGKQGLGILATARKKIPGFVREAFKSIWEEG